MVFSKARITNGKRQPIKYNPQGFKEHIEEKVNNADYTGSFSSSSVKKGKSYKSTEKGYPKCLIQFAKDKTGLHPTQKPVALLEYLIKTYTSEGETVLDNCAGSGSTGVACINTKRNFIGVEKDDKYFEIAKKRIADAIKDSEGEE